MASERQNASTRADRSATKAHLVGGGIASLAAAAFLIRDGHVAGHNITIFEELDRLGGSLDGAGTPEQGYVVRGGRMLEGQYRCTYELFDSIPTLDKKQTVTQEIVQWNKVIKTGSKARLVRDGHKIDAPEFGLSERHILNLERVAIEPEALLGNTTAASRSSSTRRSSTRISGSCGAPLSPSSLGTAPSNSSATWFASSTWSTASTS
ncbi:MAG: oleate hydratase [Reyranella sp.]